MLAGCWSILPVGASKTRVLEHPFMELGLLDIIEYFSNSVLGSWSFPSVGADKLFYSSNILAFCGFLPHRISI